MKRHTDWPIEVYFFRAMSIFGIAAIVVASIFYFAGNKIGADELIAGPGVGTNSTTPVSSAPSPSATPIASAPSPVALAELPTAECAVANLDSCTSVQRQIITILEQIDRCADQPCDFLTRALNPKITFHPNSLLVFTTMTTAEPLTRTICVEEQSNTAVVQYFKLKVVQSKIPLIENRYQLGSLQNCKTPYVDLAI